ncbi:transposon Tf2-9 polyprotein [Trichonephila clavipes]|nr:transposon Tf2-9 polyprotein [Trichonephila clavipes]
MVQVCSSRTENTQFNDFTKHSDDAVSTLDRSKDEDKQDLEILKLLEEEIVETFTENREKIREEAKRNILKMQEENCRNFNKKRKKAYQYEIGDIVAIQRTQFGTGLKLRPKFFGPYEVIKVKPKDRYDVGKIGLHERPNTTSTAADHMKMWGETV